jgi:hypothetical protein
MRRIVGESEAGLDRVKANKNSRSICAIPERGTRANRVWFLAVALHLCPSLFAAVS